MYTIFETIILNVSFIAFPLVLYLIFVAFKKHFKEGEDDTVLELTLLFTLFLSFYFYFVMGARYNLFVLTIPLLISFYFNKTNTSILISLITLLIIYSFNIDGWWSILIFLSIYFLLYYKYLTSTLSKISLTSIFTLTTVVFIFIYYLVFDEITIVCLNAIIVYVASIIIIAFIFNNVSKSIKLYLTLKDMEDDTRLKTSIFKISHEIKNPLAVMKGYLSLFNFDDKNKCEKYVNILKTEVENALLVLKDFSEMHHLTINKQMIDLNKLLLEIKETVFPFFNDKSINYSFKSEDNLFIYADYNRLKQVLINLIKNSIEACSYNGIVELRSYKSNNNLILFIYDNGCGMDKDTLEQIFTPFYSKKQYGTGLGLCLSKEIIELHGGSIKYFSSIGKSTTVKIVLPI